LKVAGNMNFKGNTPYVQLVEREYQKGVSLTKKELNPFMTSFIRSPSLAAWDVNIIP